METKNQQKPKAIRPAQEDIPKEVLQTEVKLFQPETQNFKKNREQYKGNNLSKHARILRFKMTVLNMSCGI